MMDDEPHILRDALLIADAVELAAYDGKLICATTVGLSIGANVRKFTFTEYTTGHELMDAVASFLRWLYEHHIEIPRKKIITGTSMIYGFPVVLDTHATGLLRDYIDEFPMQWKDYPYA